MIKKHFPLILFLIITVLAFLVIKPFIQSILFAAVLSYVFFPVNKFIRKITKSKGFSAFITTFLVLLLAVIPTAIIAHSLISGSYATYVEAKQKIITFDICESDGFMCTSWKLFENEVLGQNLGFYLKSAFDNFSSHVITGLYGFARGIADSILNIFMFFVLTFFLLKDGEDFVKKIHSILPFEKKDGERALKEVANVVHAVVYGSVFVAIMQGALAFLGFWLFGVSNPLLWGIVVMLASFVPFLGSSLGWLPVTLVYLADAILTPDKTAIIKGTLLLIYCAIVVSGSDNLVKPRIIGSRTKLHPAFIFLGVAGGLYLLGPIGIFAGPVIMALLVVFISIYNDYKVKN